jgi:hypothetical protein
MDMSIAPRDSFSSWLPLLLFTAAAIAYGSAVRVRRRRRDIALKVTAQLLGLSFQGDNWSPETSAPQLETRLFGYKNGNVRNIMTGNREGLDVSFFDYSFGQGRYRTEQTVAAFSQEVWLPPFALGPQGILGGAVNNIFHKDIRFESEPEFSKRFRLTSDDPENTHQLFTPAMVSFLEGFDPHSKLRLEGLGRTLVIYSEAKKIGPEQFPLFVSETTTIAKTFFSVCSAKQRPNTFGLVPDNS